ncbi:DNA repair protein RecO [uncultured Cetobacterium sp.]|uniref:DNA repair protein RecO n=2 Tax=uncultured Cetobacterium sp. TaxID=527638 RepID=UPI002637F0C8|nr:DNA repair protein RecO [uncultured Cetobacterium sp.]
MNFLKTKGIVIKKNDFGEADRYITIFSEEYGKLELFIKGIRKSKKRNQSSADLLTLSEFTFYKKNNSLILSSIDSIEYFYDIKNDLEKLEIASYILSIVNEIVLYGEQKKEFFQRLKKALEFVTKNEDYYNYVMLLRMINWIIKNEGYNILIEGRKFFNVPQSTITDISNDKVIILEDIQIDIIILINGDYLNLLNGKFTKKDILLVIYLFENYLNYHLDTKLNLKKHLLEGN